MSTTDTAKLDTVEPSILSAVQPEWLKRMRKEAWEVYRDLPLPDRVAHLWRYTDPSKFVYSPNGDNYKETISPEANAPPVEKGTTFPKILLRDFNAGKLSGIVLNNAGSTVTAKLSSELQKAGVLVGNISVFANEKPDLIEPYIGKIVGAQFGKFEAFNLAAWQNGIILYIPKGVVVDKPLHLLTKSPENGNLVTRTIVIVEESGGLSIIDEYTGGLMNSDSHYINAAAETFAGKASQLRHLMVQNLNEGARFYFTHRSMVESSAKTLTAIASFGGKITKANLGSNLAGGGSESQLEGFLFGEKRQHFDHLTVHEHHAPNTLSNINFRVVLKDRSRSAYTGRITIENNAPFSEAYQENRNLLLSSGCRIESIPELEINQDEVRCSHGAATGPPDENEIFYLKSRGIPEYEAVQLIIEGFMENSLKRIPEELRGRLRKYINYRLKGGWTFE